MGAQKFGMDQGICKDVACAIATLSNQGIQVGIVVGGGNIFRGFQGSLAGMERIPADQIGMIGTMINGLTLQQAILSNGGKARVLNALNCPGITESYQWEKAIDYLQNGEVVIMVGGTGLPYFSTDTAAALRAVEIKADILLKATKVDGVYDKDPVKHNDAKKFEKLTHQEMLQSRLAVMDAPAAALCMDNKLPILVFDVFAEDSLKKAVFSQDIGTLIVPSQS
ncbi:MAG: UMP kinase [Parachlamydiales bacterium]|nr:UMP kinase [Parachlamydiales bacterium]